MAWHGALRRYWLAPNAHSACGLNRRPQRAMASRSFAPDNIAASAMMRIVASGNRRPFVVQWSGMACKASYSVGAIFDGLAHRQGRWNPVRIEIISSE